MKQTILLLGDPKLYDTSEEVLKEELPQILKVAEDLHDSLIDFRERMGAGRAIAAPQIDVRKRVIYMYIDKPFTFINPRLEFPDDEMMEVLDDCMSFPHLYVKVIRHKRCVIHYKNEKWEDCRMALEGDLSELLQHEYDHLDGILATMRAIDEKAFIMKSYVCPVCQKL